MFNTFLDKASILNYPRSSGVLLSRARLRHQLQHLSTSVRQNESQKGESEMNWEKKISPNTWAFKCKLQVLS
jgi:hypothetical protein